MSAGRIIRTILSVCALAIIVLAAGIMLGGF